MITAESIVIQYNTKYKNSKLKDKELFDDKIRYLTNLIHPKKYISYLNKKKYIEKLLSEIIYIENGIIKYNSCDKYYKIIKEILNIYTDIKVDDSTYDVLASNDLLSLIINCIGEEYEIFISMIEMYINDIENKRVQLESM